MFSLAVWAATDVKSKKEVTETESVAVVESVKTIQLTGSIMDDKNKETLVGATLHVAGKKYYSDLDGNFCISDIQPGKHQIEVVLISYKPVVVEVDAENNEGINIYLHQN